MSGISTVLWSLIKLAALTAKFIFNSKLFYLSAAAFIIFYVIRCCDVEEYFSVEDNYSKYISNLSYSFNGRREGAAPEPETVPAESKSEKENIKENIIENKRENNIYKLDDYRAPETIDQRAATAADDQIGGRTTAKIISFEGYRQRLAKSKFSGVFTGGNGNGRSGNA